MGKIAIKPNCILNWETDYARMLVMQTLDGETSFPIIIADNEAISLLKEMENIKIKRPLTHDLFFSTLQSFHIQIQEVYIHTLMEGIFYTKMTCVKDDQCIELDARPSDAIILAIKNNVPVFVEESILNKLGLLTSEMEKYIISGKEQMEESGKPNIALEDQPLEELELRLKQSIEIEDFELASKIRDIINLRNA